MITPMFILQREKSARRGTQKSALSSEGSVRCSIATSVCMCGDQSCIYLAQPRVRLDRLNFQNIKWP